METIVVYDEETKEVLACISDDDKCFVRNGIEFKVFNDTEPVFNVEDKTVYLKENAFMLNP